MPLINVVSCLMFWTVETNEMLNESAMQGKGLKRSLKTGEALQTCLCFHKFAKVHWSQKYFPLVPLD